MTLQISIPDPLHDTVSFCLLMQVISEMDEADKAAAVSAVKRGVREITEAERESAGDCHDRW